MAAKLNIQGDLIGTTADNVEYTNSDMAKLRENYKETAATNVKVDLMLEAVAKAEAIEVTEEELTAASRGERWMPISLREKPRSGSFGNIAAKKAWMPKRGNLQPQIPIASERLA